MAQLKGYEQTQEHKDNISKSLKKGSYFNCVECGSEFWRKPNEIKKGNNKFCCKACYLKWQKGKPRSEEFKSKCKAKVPEQNGNWKGGITPINSKIRKSDEYKIWRESVFERDDWTCQKCGARSKKDTKVIIEAHHIKPFATSINLRFNIDNGITLCKQCHYKEPKGREILKNIKQELKTTC